MEAKKIVHVHLVEPYNGEQDFYFGSVKAIFDFIPAEVIGIKYTSLKSRRREMYQNKKCVIKFDELKRKKREL
jgi:hypothetical protein